MEGFSRQGWRPGDGSRYICVGGAKIFVGEKKCAHQNCGAGVGMN